LVAARTTKRVLAFDDTGCSAIGHPTCEPPRVFRSLRLRHTTLA
jgi:hypothetical protein